MRIVFGRISSTPPGEYLTKKIERMAARDAELAERLDDTAVQGLIARILGRQGGPPVPISQADEHYAITDAQEAQLSARKRCALATLYRESPLVEGETVQEDFFTFLKEPFGKLPAHTAVLRRTTNLAEIYYVYEDLMIENGELVFVERAAEPEPEIAMMATAFNSDSVKALAKKLGGGLVDGIMGTLGGLIFEAIFPPGVPDYFGEVLKEIRNIVGEELTRADVDKINGELNGVVAWAKNTYKPRKLSGAPRQELSQMLVEPIRDLYRSIGILMEPRYKKQGLSVFGIAGGVHLALMQEQALVDPLQPNPNASSFAISVKLNAQTYHDHAMGTYNEIRTKRENAVTIKQDRTVFQDPGSPYIDTKDRYAWYDSAADTYGTWYDDYTDKNKKFQSGRAKAESMRNMYMNEVRGKLVTEFGDPEGTAALWARLIKQPIPIGA